MPGIHVKQFGGIAPAINRKLLDPKFAQLAVNCDVRTGKLRPWPAPVAVGQVSPQNHLDIGVHPFFAASTPLGGANAYIDPGNQDFVLENWEGGAAAHYGVTGLPVRNQPQGRVFYWRQGVQGMLWKQQGANFEQPVGISTGPRVSNLVVSGQQIAGALPFATAYCATYVDPWGAEGSPSEPTIVPNRLNGQQVSMLISDTRPQHTSGLVRIYRAISDFSTGEDPTNVFDTTWHLVGEAGGPPGDFGFTYVDTLMDHQVEGDLLLTREFHPAPVGNIAAICKLAGNWLACVFVDGRVAISQRHQFQAWPGRNIRQLPSAAVVDAVAWGDTLLICAADGGPWRLSVRAEGVGIATQLDDYRASFPAFDQPALTGGHNRSMVATPFGAIYASAQGMVSIGPEGAIAVTTRGLVLPGQFCQSTLQLESQANVNSPGFLPAAGVWHQGHYLGAVAAGPENGTPYRYMLLDLPDGIVGNFADAVLTHLDLSPVTGPQTGQADFLLPGYCFTSYRDRLLFLVNGRCWDWRGLDASPIANLIFPETSQTLPYRWRSKLFVLPQITAMSAVKVCGLIVNPDLSCRIRIWCDGRLVIDRLVGTNATAVQIQARQFIFRLPAGWRGTDWMFELYGNAPIDEVHIATSVKELAES